MNNTIDVQVCGNQGMFPCTYKTVVLKPNIVNDKNILNQGMMNMPNTKYVIKYDFLLSDVIVEKTANVVSTNVSHCGNAAYAVALANYNAAHEAWIEADNAYTNNPNDTTLAAKNAAYAALEAAQLVLNGTPQYYYFASGAITLKKGQYVSIPDGCVLLNNSLNGVVDFILAPNNTTVYIANAAIGNYNYKIMSGIEIPANCLIEFDGGSISDGALVGDDTILIYDQEEDVVIKNVILLGVFEESAVGDPGINKKDNVNGMAIITLNKYKSFAEQLTQGNTIYKILYDFDLNGEEVTVPSNCILQFEGGSLSNGTIVGNDTCIDAELVKIFDTDVTISGTWNIAEAYPEWFGDKKTSNINKCVNSFHSMTILTGRYVFDSTIYCPEDVSIENREEVVIDLTNDDDSLCFEFVCSQSAYINLGKTNVYVSENRSGTVANVYGQSVLDEHGVFRNERIITSTQIFPHIIYDYAGAASAPCIAYCFNIGRSEAAVGRYTSFFAFHRIVLNVSRIKTAAYFKYWETNTGFIGGCLFDITTNGVENTVVFNTQLMSIVHKTTFKLTVQSNRNFKKILKNEFFYTDVEQGIYKSAEELNYIYQRYPLQDCVLDIMTYDVEELVSSEVWANSIDNTVNFTYIGHNIMKFCKIKQTYPLQGIHTMEDYIPEHTRYAPIFITGIKAMEYFLAIWQEGDTRMKAYTRIVNSLISEGYDKDVIFNIKFQKPTSNKAEINAYWVYYYIKDYLIKTGINDNDLKASFPTVVTIKFVKADGSMGYEKKVDDVIVDRFSNFKYIFITFENGYVSYKEVIKINYDEDTKDYHTAISCEELTVSAERVILEQPWAAKHSYWNGEAWVDTYGFSTALVKGLSTQRPTGIAAGGQLSPSRDHGRMFFDNNLLRAIWVKEINSNTGDVNWIEYDGAAAGSKRYGDGTDKPSSGLYPGFMYFDWTNDKPLFYTGRTGGRAWVDGLGIPSVVKKSGTFAEKPNAAANIYIGFPYFCTNKQTAEGATDGIMIYYKGQDTTDPEHPVDVWVDALGRVVS